MPEIKQQDGFWTIDGEPLNGEHRLDDGGTGWFLNGRPHRVGGPAIVRPGSEYWCQHGLKHREDGPAVVFSIGTRMWFRNGLRHRDNGPAVEAANGNRFWYQNGVMIDSHIRSGRWLDCGF